MANYGCCCPLRGSSCEMAIAEAGGVLLSASTREGLDCRYLISYGCLQKILDCLRSQLSSWETREQQLGRLTSPGLVVAARSSSQWVAPRCLTYNAWVVLCLGDPVAGRLCRTERKCTRVSPCTQGSECPFTKHPVSRATREPLFMPSSSWQN